jgi:predicted ATP-grasp superfamily ATP-dependent carboligase
VLVLDGNENQAVACVRSLGRAGHRVEVGAETRWSKAGWSRWSAASFAYPSPLWSGRAFVDAIASRAAEEPATLVLPMTERATLPISEYRESLVAAGARLVLPPHETVLAAFDKGHTTDLARALGLAVPETAVLDLGSGLRPLPRRFPVVLKPRSSEERRGASGLRTTGAPLYARNAAEFVQACDALERRASTVLVQEFVAGEGSGYFAIADRGRVLVEFAHRRLRDVRPSGSGSALRVSTPVEPRIGRSGRALLEALGWHGVAMVEFRVRPDGTPVFLEVNGRFWNSLALARHAGVDFPLLVAELAARGAVTPPPPFRSGVRCRWWLGDVRHLVEVWRGAPRGYPDAYPSRLGTLARVLLPRPGTHHDNFELADPLPELGDWLHFLTRTLPGARRRPAPIAQAQHA